MSVSTVTNQKTIQEIIDGSSKSANTRSTGELGKSDFLNLLVTQLRYQDPLKPVDDKEFIGQMAQFSALEQMQNLNNSFSASKAFSLIGKSISASITDSNSNDAQNIDGRVTNVKISQGKVFVVVNGEDVPVDSIVSVSDSSGSSSNISAYTSLIGFNVNGVAYDPSTSDMLKVNGTVTAIQKGIYEDYAVMDGVKGEIAEIVSDKQSTDPNYMKDALQNAYNNKEEITVVIVDMTTGNRVPVTVTLESLDFSNGKITAVMNGLHVPVEGITNITK